jgi:hypothetical protein
MGIGRVRIMSKHFLGQLLLDARLRDKDFGLNLGGIRR